MADRQNNDVSDNPDDMPGVTEYLKELRHIRQSVRKTNVAKSIQDRRRLMMKVGDMRIYF